MIFQIRETQYIPPTPANGLLKLRDSSPRETATLSGLRPCFTRRAVAAILQQSLDSMDAMEMYSAHLATECLQPREGDANIFNGEAVMVTFT